MLIHIEFAFVAIPAICGLVYLVGYLRSLWRPVDKCQAPAPSADLPYRLVRTIKYSGGGIPHVEYVRVSTILEESKLSRFTPEVTKNPIIGLCQRLAVYHINHGKVMEYSRAEPKRRLRLMIGRFLPNKVAKRLTSLSKHRWAQIEGQWQAVCQTVLLNPDFDPHEVDYQLIASIQRFKLWFLKLCLGEGLNKSISHMGKDLKLISSWMQYLALDCNYNQKPARLCRWPTYDGVQPVFFWFGGHLARYRWIKCPSDLQIAGLCQIRTFGRALPCPPSNLVDEGLKKTLDVLTTHRETKASVLRDIRGAMCYLNTTLKFGALPRDSHISVSLSGSLETIQENGGMATDSKRLLDPLLNGISYIRFVRSRLESRWSRTLQESRNVVPSNINVLYDCYGNVVLHLGLLGFDRGWRTVDVLYQKLSDASDARRFRATEARFSNYFGPNTGNILLFLSSGEMCTYGTYYPAPDAWFCCASSTMCPVWYTSQPVAFIPVSPVPCRLLALPEPGFKVRPLTAGLTPLILIMKAMRQMVQILLAKDGRCRIGLTTTNKLWTFLKFLGKFKFDDQTFAQSSDYESATDYIPLDVNKTLWQVFVGFLPTNHPFRVFEALIYAPRLISKLTDTNSVITKGYYLHKCGSFMGEPMSYMTLTFMNLISEVISQKYFDLRRPLHSGLSMSQWTAPCVLDPFVTAGDDKSAIRRSRLRAELSRKASIAIGFKLSIKDGDSSRLMIFCEDHTMFIRHGDIIHLMYIDVIKGRLLTNVNRPHADNRASIFGKGQMLSNQLDYLVGDIRLYARFLHFNLFLRSHGWRFVNLRIPWFLPPILGGMGLLPIKIPKWGYKYINYVIEVLEVQDWRTRLCLVWQFRSLSGRLHKGVTPRSLAWERAKTALDDLEFAGKTFDEDIKCIFTEGEIASKMLADGVPNGPLSQTYTWDDIRTYAYERNFVPITDVIEQFERVDCFQQLLENPGKIARRTVKNWTRRSSRFWKKRINMIDPPEIDHRFKSLSDLGQRATRCVSGFCSLNIADDVLRYGPRLTIDNRISREDRRFLGKVDRLGALLARANINKLC